MICQIMAAEVTEPRGLMHSPSPGDHIQTDSSLGRVLIDGEGGEVVRPWVRRQSEDDSSREVELASFRAGQGPLPYALQEAERGFRKIVGARMRNQATLRFHKRMIASFNQNQDNPQGRSCGSGSGMDGYVRGQRQHRARSWRPTRHAGHESTGLRIGRGRLAAARQPDRPGEANWYR